MSDRLELSLVEERELRRVNLIRFLLPLALFVVVAVYETQEHWIKTGNIEFQLASEILFFGIIGPTAVFFALTYIMFLLRQVMAARQETVEMNLALEQTVTERTVALAERNAELAAANLELETLDQMKSDFVSLVSHELRAPLTTLNGGLEMALQENHGLPERSRKILEVMSAESQRLTRFVQTILDVSQLEAGRLALNLGPIAVRPLLERAVAAVLHGDRPVEWQIQPDLPPLWADEIYYEETIRNLLTNVDKYTPANQPIAIAATAADHCLNVAVTDFGPGISPEQQDGIFRPFQRGEHGDRISQRGWGLGLHFAQALTTAQGGHLTLTSPVHSPPQPPGTCFTVTMPLVEEVPEDD